MSFLTDLLAVLLDPVSGAEQIWYVSPVEGKRQIYALIQRRPATPDVAGAGVVEYVVTVSRDAVTGLARPVPGKDELHILKHLHDTTATVFRVTEILEQDAAASTLVVRA